MRTSRPTPGPLLLIVLLTLGLSPSQLFAQTPTPTQTPANFSELWTQATAFYNQGNFVNALPLFEKLNAEKPNDPKILEYLAFCTLAHARAITEPEARKTERIKARKYGQQAQALGNSDISNNLFSSIPEDGSESAFSDRADVDAIMKEGESIFVKGDYDGAIHKYQQALALDPKNYLAALFSGDCYFKKQDHEQAGKWFLRAIEIDPNQETAYRYWGDDLLAQKRANDAKEKFVQAIVAQPYDQRSWTGLIFWAKQQNAVLGHPPIKAPSSVKENGKDAKGQNRISITIDPSMLADKNQNDGKNAWVAYSLAKALWHTERFNKEYPNEKQYRHTLSEEVDGYNAVLAVLREDKSIKTLDPELAMLKKISDEGLLEPFILISHADQGIAQDYDAYRNAHRDKVAQYINEWIIHFAP